MVNALRHLATVSPEGSVSVRVPELAPGSRVEVILLFDQGAHDDTAGSQLAALESLQKGLKLNSVTAADWIDQARTLREGFGTRE